MVEGETIVNSIINAFKCDYMMRVEEKINLTALIFTHRDAISKSDDFFEEECHLSLVNWIYAYINELKKDKSVIDDRVYHLLYNILIIFEIFPLKANDLFELKIFEKLNKFRKFIKTKNINIYHQVDRLLNYWSSFCTDNSILMKRNRPQVYYEEEVVMERAVKKVKLSI